LAAEVRANPKEFADWLGNELGIVVSGDLLSIRLEMHRDERLDIVIRFAVGPEIGIEATFAHEATLEQLEREGADGRKLILLLVDEMDSPDGLPATIAVTTWSRLLGAFSQSRLLDADLEGLTTNPKLVARRQFKAVSANLRRRIPAGEWVVGSTPGSSGFPSILIQSVAAADGLSVELCGQIQAVRGRSNLYQASIGIVIDPAEDLESLNGIEPRWIAALQLVGPRVEEMASLAGLSLLQNKAPLTRNKTPRRSAELAETFGLPRKWAKGYEDGYLGFKTGYSESVAAQADCAMDILLEMKDLLSARADEAASR
jgi:hypothetical protein